MSGHSKWSTIKRKKAVTDARRASSWTKLIREITVAAKAGGGDPSANARLRKAIDDAKAANMPGDNIDRAIKKGTGELEGVSYEEFTYEGYAAGGVAILIDGSTDNPNRTVADIRHAFSRNHGNLGTTNSVAWMFERKGQILLPTSAAPEEKAMEDALEAGASDFEVDGDYYVVSTDPHDYHAVIDALAARGYRPESSELAMVPKNLVKPDAAEARRVLKLIEVLEELDDVSQVFTTLDVEALDLEEADA
ncbi:MAG: YebC/PmpR family DNA-binding transcriptional regulator [Gemmatimonadales bacterium]|nr:YebC/PmpR family DNA-binding transcriptional regulator [Gemmatimonadales bacterium]MDZ4390733.1 YebC/PmpR family DNA-binding transcriptional regulator [Gemmatimonadales bacterium]